MSDSITITIMVDRPLGCPYDECDVMMRTDTFSSVGFPERMNIREAVDRITVEVSDAIADELGVGYLWADDGSNVDNAEETA